MAIAEMVGIKVLATGGIGGVHRAASLMMDISADVSELGRTNVAVVCSGPRPYLDIMGTLEFLETRGVPVATFKPEQRGGAGGGSIASFGSNQTQRGTNTGGDPIVSFGPGEDLVEEAGTMVPAFYSSEGRYKSPLVIENAKEAAQIICMFSHPSPKTSS